MSDTVESAIAQHLSEGTRDQIELSQLAECAELNVGRLLARAEAAEARCARLEKDGTALADRAQAFLRYFNPVTDLTSAKEDQWWSVFDAINDWRSALSDTEQETGDG